MIPHSVNFNFAFDTVGHDDFTVFGVPTSCVQTGVGATDSYLPAFGSGAPIVMEVEVAYGQEVLTTLWTVDPVNWAFTHWSFRFIV